MKNQWLFVVLLGVALTSSAGAAPPAVTYRHHRISVDSGVHDARAGVREYVAYTGLVRFAGAPWLRLHVADYQLGQGSYILLRPLSDPAVALQEKDVYQRLDARSLPNWQNKSALFNGDAIQIELHVGEGDRGVFIRLDEALEGEFTPPPALRSLCGADSRVASTDNRVGRMYFGGCTAWRISSGAFLTAGHCVDFDPDDDATGCNPLLPDGVLDLSGFIEFDIPASTAGGATLAADPEDQYPVDTSPAFWRFDGGCQGLGKDWCVFGVFPNANTGLLPHQAYGFPFRMTRENPANGNTIRITGCGSDTGTQNFTLQTATDDDERRRHQNHAKELQPAYAEDLPDRPEDDLIEPFKVVQELTGDGVGELIRDSQRPLLDDQPARAHLPGPVEVGKGAEVIGGDQSHDAEADGIRRSGEPTGPGHFLVSVSAKSPLGQGSQSAASESRNADAASHRENCAGAAGDRGHPG